MIMIHGNAFVLVNLALLLNLLYSVLYILYNSYTYIVYSL